MVAFEAKRSFVLFSFFPVMLHPQEPFGKIDFIYPIPRP